MNNSFKRILSVLLVLVMCAAMLPAPALAEDTEAADETVVYEEYTEDSTQPDDTEESEECVESGFELIFADPCIAEHDFEADYERLTQNTASEAEAADGSLLMASLENAPYGNVDNAAAALRNTLLNKDSGIYVTRLNTKNSAYLTDRVEESYDYGAITIKYSLNESQLAQLKEAISIENETTKKAEIFKILPLYDIVDKAIEHDKNQPKWGDYLYRGRMIAFSVSYSLSYYKSSGELYNVATLNFIPYMTTTVKQEETADKCYAEVIESLNLDGLSDVEKIRSIYDWICSNIDYDYSVNTAETYDANVHSAYKGIVEKKCVCQGYATVLYRLCLECGIDARSIGYNSGHEWNIVEVDGRYYFLDSTWDANYSSSNWRYFLRGLTWWNANHTNGSTVYSPGNLPYKSSSSVACTAKYNVSELDYRTYSVQFDPNGGTGEMAGQKFIIGEEQNLTKNSFTREGYLFNGWNTKSDGSGKGYADGQAVKDLASTDGGTVTLYAMWADCIVASIAENATINGKPIESDDGEVLLNEICSNPYIHVTDVSETNKDAKINIQVVSITGEYDDSENFCAASVKYDVKPVTVTDNNDIEVISEELTSEVTFRLPVPSGMTGDYVTISHIPDGWTSADWSLPYAIQGDDKYRYVEITVNSFSDFLMEQNSYSAWNKNTAIQYSTLSDALDNSSNGDVIQLLQDIDSTNIGSIYIIVEKGRTLDINGQSIIDAKLLYATGQVIDSATERGYVSSEGWMLGKEQVYTPVYDAANDGHQFISLSFAPSTSGGTEIKDDNVLVFYLDSNSRESAFPVLKLNSDYTNTIVAYVSIIWTGSDDAEVTKSFRYNDNLMKKVVTAEKTTAFTAKITGLTGTATVQPKFVFYDKTGAVELFTLNGPAFVTDDGGETWHS